MPYETREQLNLRLARSMVRHNGRPVFVDGVAESGNLLAKYPLNAPGHRRFQEVDPYDGNWDVSSPPLGLCKLGDGRVFYLSRVAVSHATQGIDRRNLRWDLLSFQSSLSPAPSPSFSDHLRPISRTINGDYPSETLRPGVISPLDRQFALGMDPHGISYFFYKSNRIAYSENNGEDYRLLPQYAHMRELVTLSQPQIRLAA